VLLNAAGTTVSYLSRSYYIVSRVSGLVVVGGDTQLQLLAIPLKSCSPRDVSGMSLCLLHSSCSHSERATLPALPRDVAHMAAPPATTTQTDGTHQHKSSEILLPRQRFAVPYLLRRSSTTFAMVPCWASACHNFV
jgi:hypothetical protein